MKVVKAKLRALAVVLLFRMALGQEPAKDRMPAIEFPNAALPASARPTAESFRSGTFREFNGKKLSFSARLQTGVFTEKYKPFGRVEVEFTGFHDIQVANATFGIAEYHKTSVGGSSSNNCFVQVVRFNKGSNPLLTQQIQFGCDSQGSGSVVSPDGSELTVRQGYKWDRNLGVVRFKWDGSRFSITDHTVEPEKTW